MTGLDLCPRCGAYAQPMVWLGENRGWICEDCWETEQKAKEEKRHACINSNNSNNLHHACCNDNNQ